MATRNAYASRKPRTQLSVCAFFDLLGFTNAVRDASSENRADELLWQFYEVMRPCYASLVDRSDRSGRPRRAREVKIFTDNVVIGEPVRLGGGFEIWSVLSDLALLQLALATQGFFVRGGVSVGDLYIDNQIVYGSALLDAHDAEIAAGTPRVILHESARRVVQAEIDEHVASYGHTGRQRCDDILLRDEDGKWFLNYLLEINHGDANALDYEALDVHREIVSARLLKHNGNVRVLEKYVWAARYHNYFCSRIGDDYQHRVRILRGDLKAEPVRPIYSAFY